MPRPLGLLANMSFDTRKWETDSLHRDGSKAAAVNLGKALTLGGLAGRWRLHVLSCRRCRKSKVSFRPWPAQRAGQLRVTVNPPDSALAWDVLVVAEDGRPAEEARAAIENYVSGRLIELTGEVTGVMRVDSRKADAQGHGMALDLVTLGAAAPESKEHEEEPTMPAEKISANGLGPSLLTQIKAIKTLAAKRAASLKEIARITGEIDKAKRTLAEYDKKDAWHKAEIAKLAKEQAEMREAAKRLRDGMNELERQAKALDVPEEAEAYEALDMIQKIK